MPSATHAGVVMAVEVFPFGQNLANPESWLGLPSTKSQRWSIAYDGAFAIVCGYHSFIFFGLDSLHIGILNLFDCGPSANLPLGKIFKRIGESAKTAKRIEKSHEAMNNGKMSRDAAEMEYEQDQVRQGMQLYRRMQECGPTFINAHMPFSFNDLSGTSGNILGAEVELLAAAAGYTIDAASFRTGTLLFGPSLVVNMSKGLVTAGASLATGIWIVEKSFNLYQELGSSATRRCRVEHQAPAYDQPYRVLDGIQPYIAELPPAGCAFTETGFNPSRFIR